MSSPSPAAADEIYDTLPERIIAEVKKRPALYDSRLGKHRDRALAAKLWQEVYQNVDSAWGNLSEDGKRKRGRLIQKKWKNMRDSFAKELIIQKRKSGRGLVKKKKYVHFDAMLFLLPSLQKRKTRSASSTSEPAPAPASSPLPRADPEPNNQIPKDNDPNTKSEDHIKLLLQMLSKNQNTCEYDEDISFSQMIVPVLRKLNDDQKHYAKIEIMNILQKAKSYPFSRLPQNDINELPFLDEEPSPCAEELHSPPTPPTPPPTSPVPKRKEVIKTYKKVRPKIRKETIDKDNTNLLVSTVEPTKSVPLQEVNHLPHPYEEITQTNQQAEDDTDCIRIEIITEEAVE